MGSSGNFGQGFQFGTGSWRPLAGASGALLLPLAADAKATGYYRTEDADLDPLALATGNVRVCGTNTGRDEETLVRRDDLPHRRDDRGVSERRTTRR